MNSSREYEVKICVFGSASESKTSFVRNFCDRKLPEQFIPAHGVDVATRGIRLDGYDVKLILMNPAGLEFLGKLRSSGKGPLPF